jgi:hypothetical protein
VARVRSAEAESLPLRERGSVRVGVRGVGIEAVRADGETDADAERCADADSDAVGSAVTDGERTLAASLRLGDCDGVLVRSELGLAVNDAVPVPRGFGRRVIRLRLTVALRLTVCVAL